MPVSARFLLEGAWYALEQCGLLLGDAVDLFDRGRVATALGIALLAREEFGKARILFDLYREIQQGRDVELDEVTEKIESHEAKLRAGQVSVILSVPASSELAELMRRQWENPQSEDATRAREQIEKITRMVARRAPDERQRMRMRALYVDADDSAGRWIRPGEFPRDQARGQIVQVANDYSVFCHKPPRR
jgi:AbiV family abortive infection protein